MDRQDVFNRVYKHALSMQAPAIDPEDDNNCKYRSPTGPCLIGSLITDEAYNLDIEHMGADAALVCLALEKSGVEVKDSSDEKFLTRLQATHDMSTIHWEITGKEYMLEGLREIAESYSLEVPEGETK